MLLFVPTYTYLSIMYSDMYVMTGTRLREIYGWKKDYKILRWLTTINTLLDIYCYCNQILLEVQ